MCLWALIPNTFVSNTGFVNQQMTGSYKHYYVSSVLNCGKISYIHIS